MKSQGVQVVFVDLQARQGELVRRMQSRDPHYMKPEMVESQLAIYGAPATEEVDVLPVNAEKSFEEVIEEVEALLQMVGA